jgi:hypothetical protein
LPFHLDPVFYPFLIPIISPGTNPNVAAIGKPDTATAEKRKSSTGNSDITTCVPVCCADRWLLNKFGEDLRNLLSERRNTSMIVNLNNTDPFEETVYGYPIIILIDQAKSFEEIDYFRIKDLSHLELLLSTPEAVHLTVSTPKKSDPWIFERCL